MRALYAFSGDPITYGHIDIVQRAARTYNEVVVAIGENPQKTGKYLLSRDERLALVQRCLETLPNVRVEAFNGLLGEHAYRHGFDVIVRGVRNVSDLEGELVLFAVNESLHPSVDTVFFPTRRQLSHISSGVVKAIVAEGGDVSAYCPLCVKEALERKLLGRFAVGVAGGIAAGKSHVARKLVEVLNRTATATYVSLDEVGHYVLSNSPGHIYAETRLEIIKRFGGSVAHEDGSIDRHALGRIVFADAKALAELNRLMREPMLNRLYEVTRSLQANVVVLEGAILVEACWVNLVNNNVILVDAPEDVRLERLIGRGNVTPAEARTKIARQVSAPERRKLLDRRLREERWGRVWEVDSRGTPEATLPQIETLAAELLRLAKG